MARDAVTEVGEAAFLLRLADPERLPSLVRAVDSARDSRVVDLVPGADSLLVVFADPTTPRDRSWLATALEAARSGAVQDTSRAPALHRIPVAYGGPDLERVASHAGLRPDEVVELHASGAYRVAFVGFQPGFAYLAGLPSRLRVPRLSAPRPRVPGGSLGIGGDWTGFYPSASPGGWNLIGRTDEGFFDPGSSPPCRFATGDLVQLVPR
jgi:KipI family sensor histidine kinase inhibitor